MTESRNTTALREARDQLLQLSDDYDAAVSEFRWPTIEGTFNWATDWFDVNARGNEATALHIVEEDGREQKVSFDEMARRSDKVATWLEDAGVGVGDSVIVMLGNQVELWETMLALMKLGAIIMPTTIAVGPAELTDRISRGGARFVIANVADAGKFDEVPGDYTRVVVGDSDLPGWISYREANQVKPRTFTARTSASDPLLYYFTSGTTSRPKLVVHTQVSYPVGHLSTMYFLGVRPGDVHLNISSPGWAKHAWSCFFGPWNAGATVFIYNYSRFDASALIAQIRRAGVTTFCAPPTVWRMLIQADLSGGVGVLREAIGAGEPLNREVISQVQQAWGLTIRDGFGQTETTALIGNTPGAPVKAGSMGRPLPGVQVVLVDPATGKQCSSGEICLGLDPYPLNLMTGYLDAPEMNEKTMTGGYYHTGDVAIRDNDGYITFIGRTDDVFKSSDFKISPFELESVLIEHPAVAEAAVVAASDPVRLAVPKAYVVLAAGWEPDRDTALAILRYARENLAPYLRVRRVEFCELPKTMSGKIRRVELREREIVLADVGTKIVGEWRYDQFPELRA